MISTLSTLARGGKLLRIAAAGSNARRAEPEQRAAARQALAALLADARGIPMKIGQFLATGNEEDPLQALVTGIEPLPLEHITPELERALGKPLNQVFSAFESRARAASLGQVHRARLLDGSEVAVKVQYPDIAAAVESELRLLGLVPGLGPVRRWGFNLDGYREALHSNLDRELDYRVEADHQTRFHAGVQMTGLVVPRVYAEYRGKTLLIQSWETGEPLVSAQRFSKPARFRVGMTLLETLFQSLFSLGLVHGDPHPGNYLFRLAENAQPEVVLLDYGCMIEVSEAARRGLLRLIVGLREGTRVDLLACFAEMGFATDKLTPIADTLPELSRALFAPFLSDAAFNVDQWRLGERVEALLGELKWWFRAAGPPQLFLLLRAFHGVVTLLSALGVSLPWWPVLKRAVKKQTWDQLHPSALQSVAAAAAPPTAEPGSPALSGARLLRVRVTKAGEERVALAFPARLAFDLQELVPEDVAQRLNQRGVDLVAIEHRLRREGLSPQTLFDDPQGDQHYRIWLE